MESTKNFKVYRAGAGSGKTFQLIREILSLALSMPQADYYKHILAITFTNAAAHEMRHRFIEALQLFAESDLRDLEAHPLFIEVCNGCMVSGAEVKHRAKLTYRHVLHHYEQLSIGTIDSYAQKLVRSFAFELNIAGDYKLELEKEDFYERVVDACLDEVGLDMDLTEYLKFLILGQLNDEKAWKAKTILTKYAKFLEQEGAVNAASKLMLQEAAFFTQARSTAFNRIQLLVKERIKLATEALVILNTYSTDMADYPGKSTGYLSTIIKLTKGIMPSSYKLFKTVCENGQYFAQKSPINVKAADAALLHSILSELLSHLEGKAAAERLLYHNIAAEAMGLGLLKVIAHFGEMLRNEEHLLLIDDLHKRVHQVLCEQSSPFLFERLGVRYKHILTDEFQDTSEVQWSNLLPLYANALSESGATMVVGDAKQSIYRFRGGKVRQFVDLPKVPTFHMSAQEASLFSASFSPTVLDKNRRSDEIIVQFNNHLYATLAPALNNLKHVYDDVAQEAVKRGSGWVTAREVIDADGPNTVVKLVTEALNAGFLPNEVAVLVYKKDKGLEIIEALNTKAIRVQSEESLLLINSHKVSFLEAWFNYLERPNNQEAVLAIVAQLTRDGKDITLASFSKQMHENQWTFALAMENKVRMHLPALFEGLHEDIYDEAVRVMSVMHWKMDVFVEFYLNELFQKSRKEFFSRHKWNFWWKSRRLKISIKTGSDPQAVRLMTVHKAKGLEFPVVIFCAYAVSGKLNSEWYDLPLNDCMVESLPLNVYRPSSIKSNPLFECNEELKVQNEVFLEELDLESLNLRYVATTRAKSCLHIIVGQTKKDASYWNAISQVPGAQTIDDVLHWGQPLVTEVREIAEKSKAPDLFIGMTSTAFERIAPPIMSQSQRWGHFLHDCLSRIRKLEDIERAVSHTYIPHQHNAWLNEEEMRSNLERLLHQPQISPWFDPSATVWMERDIYLVNGDILRPDRVIQWQDRIVVVDYKTGKEDEKHVVQVQHYMQAMASIYPNHQVAGHLWYLESNLVRQVNLVQ